MRWDCVRLHMIWDRTPHGVFINSHPHFEHLSYIRCNCYNLGNLQTEVTVFHPRSPKMVVFWVLKLCSAVDVYRRSRDRWCFNHQGGSSETSVNVYLSIQCYILEESHLIIRFLENPKFNLVWNTWRTGKFKGTLFLMLFCRSKSTARTTFFQLCLLEQFLIKSRISEINFVRVTNFSVNLLP